MYLTILVQNAYLQIKFLVGHVPGELKQGELAKPSDDIIDQVAGPKNYHRVSLSSGMSKFNCGVGNFNLFLEKSYVR